ncbi:para-aminobenzoate synthetase [Skermanella aerolata]|uniref:aminodeoxychorismate synthase component I n=1 Tax=Skermanella aerolata TaxID=393310 RepID=UPI003D1F8B3A
MRTLIIDNYDSFTYNVFHLLALVNGCEPLVVRNDALSWDELQRLDYDNVVLSPGPGTPTLDADFGICARLIREETAPVLGICLGHQGICHVLGGVVERAPVPMHGRVSGIHHTGSGLFQGLPSPFRAVRYHSLVAVPPLPPGLLATAWTEDGLIMAVEHETRPLWGVQFHPESILSEHGDTLLRNFRDLTARYAADRPRGKPRASRTTAKATQRRAEGPAAWRLQYRRIGGAVDPAAAFRLLFANSSNAFWLDGAALPAGGFSYMGDDGGPNASVHSHRSGTMAGPDENILTFVQRRLAGIDIDAQLAPFPFKGGFVGYLGYELRTEDGWRATPSSPHPDAQLIFPGRFLCFDHGEEAVYAVTVAPEGGDPELGWLAHCSTTLERLELDATPAEEWDAAGPPAISWHHSTPDYLRLIEACLEEIRAGESYEVCLTNRLYLPPLDDPLGTYLLLRRLNPAPHAAYLRFGELSVLCSSPEQFLRIDPAGTVRTKPIKGTRRRGKTPEEDARLRAALAGDEKDRSENLMITDLLRNDLGRVCQVGSVHVPSLMDVESYRTVHQLVTTVEGRLRPECDAVDCFRATFPGGSMTGAPKRRTMEIIERLEGTPRGIYSGSIGFFSLDGAADLNIVIRTIVSDGQTSTVGTGGAIVALSDPADEVAEIELKAAALVAAVTKSRSKVREPEE